jgi:hypothetical protein
MLKNGLLPAAYKLLLEVFAVEALKLKDLFIWN